MFICYATYANEVKLVQMGGETQYNVHSLYNLCKWGVKHSTILMFICYVTCEDDVKLVQINEGWNVVQYSFVMQLVQVRGGTQYNVH